MLPAGEKPEYTEGHEGFFHVHTIHGGVETVTMEMLVRDHDRAHFERRKALLDDMAAFFNKKYGEGSVEVHHRDVYYNMLEKIEGALQKAIERVGVEPDVQPIRGGTDGARLSFMGLPCPNLFTGGANFHGRFEYLPLPSLQKAAEVVLAIMIKAGEQCKAVNERK